MTFEKYIIKVTDLLCCAMPEHKKNRNGCFEYKPSDIYSHVEYFKNCFTQKVSPQEALTLFYNYLHKL